MNFNMDGELALYQMIVELKKNKSTKSFIEAGTLFNQKVLTANGAIRASYYCYPMKNKRYSRQKMLSSLLALDGNIIWTGENRGQKAVLICWICIN